MSVLSNNMFFQQKTAYEMRISDWSSDVCSSDLAVGAIAYTRFANSPEPLTLILRELGSPLAAQYLAVSAVIALPTVILAFFYGQSRIFFTMARDGLLPAGLAKLSAREIGRAHV